MPACRRRCHPSPDSTPVAKRTTPSGINPSARRRKATVNDWVEAQLERAPETGRFLRFS